MWGGGEQHSARSAPKSFSELPEPSAGFAAQPGSTLPAARCAGAAAPRQEDAGSCSPAAGQRQQGQSELQEPRWCCQQVQAPLLHGHRMGSTDTGL